MTIKSEYSYQTDEREWNNKLLQNKISTVYQTTNWQRIYQQVYDSKPIFITVTTSNGKIVGQLASVIHKKLFWQNANIFSSFLGNKLNLRTTLNWFHGPIIHDYHNQKEIISEIFSCIDKVCKENQVTIVRGISPDLVLDLLCKLPMSRFDN